MALQSSLDGTSQSQRALHNLQSSYYQQMQRMMPAWEEHKTKLKLKKLSMLQSHKTKLEQQRLRVAELSKYNQELDSRLYQFADQVQALERQVMDESSGHLDQQRTVLLREQQDRERRYRLEAEVQRALQEEERPEERHTARPSTVSPPRSTTTTHLDHSGGSSTVATDTTPLAQWSMDELGATLTVLRQCIESNRIECLTRGYANERTRSHWQDTSLLTSAQATRANEW
jgi:hypothetical protein